jgi:DNA-directed RNA polymerase subunit RPC12/RpoP
MSTVACAQCGASTPLPEDLRVPTFACRYCGHELSTEAVAGEGAVRVDEMRAFFNAVVESPHAIPTAPKLVHGDGGTRDAKCAHCGAAISVPLTITKKTVRCGGCGKEELISRYVSDAERLQLDMARQIAGNQALKDLIVAGLNCPKCGAHNTISEPVPVQITCASCRQVILLSGFVPPDAVDRARLKVSAYAMRDELVARHAASQRRGGIIAGVVIGAIVVVVAIGALIHAISGG